jgi:hypothetical protein
MAIEYIEKDEWLEQINRQETVLIGAFAPSLNQITIQLECRGCGRPVYVSPYEKGAATVLCMVCGLSIFSDEDRETISQALKNKSDQ